jgi:hypothetical protein
MDRQSLNALNAAVLVAILAVACLFWFFAREQFAWAIIIIAVILLFACYVNIVRKFPWHDMSSSDALLALAIFLILAFAWFYMRDQFCWAGFVVVMILLVVEIFRLRQWLKDAVSIQVTVKRRENDDGRSPGEPGEGQKPGDKR